MMKPYENQLLAKLEGGEPLTYDLAHEAATYIRLLCDREKMETARANAAEDAASVSDAIIANAKVHRLTLELAQMTTRAENAEETLAEIARLVPY